MIGFSDFKEVAPAVFIEPGLSPEDTARFLAFVEEAKARISSTYGSYSAQSVLIIGNSQKMLRYGNGYGTSHFLPWTSYVVIGQNGQNVDVVAHELAHAELVQRVGYWKRMTQIPAWFEEGIAMQVDYRKPFDIGNFSSRDRVGKENLWWQAQFNSGGRDAVMFNYAWSKELVRSWRLKHPQNRFHELAEEIREGRSFEEAFAHSAAKN